MKNIPFMDLTEHTRRLRPEIDAAVAQVCETAAFSDGPFVERFEAEFASWLGAPRFAGVSSGSDALLLALLALGVGPGDEVIVPANTFIATAFAPMRIGAVPVFADCDPNTWQIDPADAEARITPRTRAIIGVHLYGQAFPLDEINALAARHGLFVLEDCAQSQGTLYRGRKVGALSDAGCFSFYPTKNLGACGQGGGVACADEAADEKVRLLRAQGSRARYHHDALGYNMRLDGMQAAILSAKLMHLDDWNARRAEIVARYHREIQNPALTFQAELPHTKPAWYLAVALAEDRDGFIAHMREKGVLCGIHYPIPCHLQEAMRELGHQAGDIPNAEYQAARCVSLPLFPELDDESVDRVIEAANSYDR